MKLFNFEIIKNELSQIEQELSKIAASYDGLIGKTARSCLSRPGKRLRPALVILSAKMFGRINKTIIKVAALLEIIHAASLLHDDVVDNAKLRRGKPAVNVLWGNKVSVLLADYLLAESIYFLCDQKYLKILKILASAIKDMSLGQLQELERQNDFSVDLKQYKEVINNKTASLISAACQIGAILSESDSRYIKFLAEYGQNLGMAFQISDDILDFWGKSHLLGKSTGSDISQKKFTAPLIYVFEKAISSDKKILTELFSNGRMKNPALKGEVSSQRGKIYSNVALHPRAEARGISSLGGSASGGQGDFLIKKGDLKKVILLMNKYKVKEKVQDLAKSYSNLAQNKILSMPDNSIKKTLLDLASQIVYRKK